MKSRLKTLLLAMAMTLALSPTGADATFYVRDDPTGGDCVLIGTWDPNTRTCTLTGDLTIDASIENGVMIESSGVTLDGGGHTIAGVGEAGYVTFGVGSQTRGLVGVTIRNFVLDGFNSGVFLDQAFDSVIEDNVIRNAPHWAGIAVRAGSTRLRITGNRMTNVWQGIRLEGVTDSLIQDNQVEFTTGGIGIDYGSNRNLFTGNDVGNAPSACTGCYAISVVWSDDNTVRDNTFRAVAGVVHLLGNRNSVFQNNVFGYQGAIVMAYYADTYLTGNALHQEPPVGGNYWSSVQCSDVNTDGFCDAPASFYDGAQDAYPWSVPNGWRDVDADGTPLAVDCDDSNPAAFPGAAEIPYDGVDQNCNGMADDDDLDGDGFSVAMECNDADASVHPGATEVKLDGVDQDCNGYDLTIEVLLANYRSNQDSIKVVATSLLGPAALLGVDGLGPMTWDTAESVWVATLQPVGGNPGAIAVSGVEGQVTVAVSVR